MEIQGMYFLVSITRRLKLVMAKSLASRASVQRSSK
jgi:hypothetical protein